MKWENAPYAIVCYDEWIQHVSSGCFVNILIAIVIRQMRQRYEIPTGRDPGDLVCLPILEEIKI